MLINLGVPRAAKCILESSRRRKRRESDVNTEQVVMMRYEKVDPSLLASKVGATQETSNVDNL